MRVTGESKGVNRKLFGAAMVLILLGLLGGFFIPSMARPRLGLSAHLVATEGGLLLGLLAVAWSHIRLSPGLARVAQALLIYANYANWLACILGGVWRATKFMPIMGGESGAEGWQEGVVGFLLISLSLAAISGMVMILYGLRAAPSDQEPLQVP